jgi:hypothetical protein
MNIAQQLFMVFFAIFWGTSSNAWPRWKPFHWTLFFELRPARNRVILSVIFLNLCPIIYFAAVIAWLGRSAPAAGYLSGTEYFREAFRGISPGLAVFGFYRIWFSIIEMRPSCFYLKTLEAKDELNEREPTSDSLKILERLWWVNLLFGCLYVVVPLIIVWFLRYQ